MHQFRNLIAHQTFSSLVLCFIDQNYDLTLVITTIAPLSHSLIYWSHICIFLNKASCSAPSPRLVQKPPLQFWARRTSSLSIFHPILVDTSDNRRRGSSLLQFRATISRTQRPELSAIPSISRYSQVWSELFFSCWYRLFQWPGQPPSLIWMSAVTFWHILQSDSGFWRLGACNPRD